MALPELQKPAPNFTLVNQANEPVELSNFLGKNIVLYFYPKDNTPGCTIEAQEFRDHLNDFAKLNTIILGISRDNIKSHCKFIQDHQLNFDLLADTEEVACQLYDVIRLKNMYGKQVRGIERSTFLIDTLGILRKEWRKVKVEGHVLEVLHTVKTL